MNLDASQRATLKAAILAETDPTVTAALAIRNDVAIANWYNAASTFIVWKTSITRKEMHNAYVWTEMDSFTNGAKQFQFNLLISEGTVNPSDANVRQGFQDIFSGAGLATTRAALIALAKRAATKAEALFATGTGTDGSPGTLGVNANGYVEGALSYNDVSLALNA